MDTLGSRCSFLSILGCLLGVSWDPLRRHVCDFSMVLDAKMGDGSQVHVFGDPGMEMMSESGGCMCYKHSKNNGFSDISLFPLIPEFSVSREGFRCHFADFW
jgi:hypothetical protein